MTNPKGYRRGTRDMFSRAYKTNGVQHLSTYLKTYKMGETVDIKVRLTFLFWFSKFAQISLLKDPFNARFLILAEGFLGKLT